MLCQLHIKNRFLRQAAWRCCRLQVSKAHSGSYPHGFSGDGVHHEWRVRLFDSAHGRSYAIDLGHFPGRWFLGPSASVAFSRSDNLAGRPHSFRVSSKQLEGLKSSGTDLSLGTNLAVEEDFGFTVSDTEFSLVTQAYGALLSIQSTSAHAERQLSRTTALLQGDMSCLKSQALRLPVSYTYDHPAGYHEEGLALAHVQHTWGNTLVPHWLTCLGYHFSRNRCIEAILDMTVAEGHFSIGYHSSALHWFFASSEPDNSLTSEVAAEYGKLKVTAQQGSKKLVISASAPHRTFDILSLPTQQGYQDKGIQTNSGTASVEAFEHDKLVDSNVVMGVNMQFGAAYAERTVQRMTAQQYSSPLRYKGKGITR